MNLRNLNSIVLEKSDEPQITNFSTTGKSTHDSVSVSWDDVFSNGSRKLPSIYLLGLKVEKEVEFVVGLVENTSFTLLPRLLCKMLYNDEMNPNFEFALTIYPINFNGPHDQKTASQRQILIQTAYTAPAPIPPLQSLSILPGYPALVEDAKHEAEYDDLLWKM